MIYPDIISRDHLMSLVHGIQKNPNSAKRTINVIIDTMIHEIASFPYEQLFQSLNVPADVICFLANGDVVWKDRYITAASKWYPIATLTYISDRVRSDHGLLCSAIINVKQCSKHIEGVDGDDIQMLYINQLKDRDFIEKISDAIGIPLHRVHRFKHLANISVENAILLHKT